jgi:hypothetical protein
VEALTQWTQNRATAAHLIPEGRGRRWHESSTTASTATIGRPKVVFANRVGHFPYRARVLAVRFLRLRPDDAHRPQRGVDLIELIEAYVADELSQVRSIR